ncbi:class I SAM-dependent methyltransferase [Geotalea toluenoxydans]|uniref:class I SAM-dependent methyltransferase n=1 Tax=Geotalea toluenoxydans TaxID=421624 RepID=UPI0006D1D2A7|nr:class I SAM-dependent methyltransferase [Geotalea toluenoxydans]
MELSFAGFVRLHDFLKKLENDTYPELPTQLHTEITNQQLNNLLAKYPLQQGAAILDVGCGQGPALDIFREKGFAPLGITLNDEDIEACRKKGHQVTKMEQSFLDYLPETFDLIWARHVIEHSIFPHFTLAEFARVLKAGGLLYLEVPAPETACHHENNQNHYSILNRGMWVSLLGRNGLQLLEQVNFNFTTGLGPDEYWGFICKKQA